MSLKMKAAAGAFLLALIGSTAQKAEAAVTVFTDFGAWVLAVGNVAGSFTTETFNTGAITAPELSVSSTNGSIGSARFNDRVVPGGATTTWSFSTPIIAFGGFFDLTPVGSGTGLAFDINGVSAVTPGIDNVPTTFNGFYGFLSTSSFNAVVVKAGPACCRENYNLDNLSYAVATAVPEPTTWAMMLVGFAGIGYAAHRRRTAVIG